MTRDNATTDKDILRIANCSGFYGDRLSAAEEMVTGGPIDVLTGDYLAELTMAILHKDRQNDPTLGYAKTFPLQLQQIAALCLQRKIKIVVNAGGLNPASCAEVCRQIYADLGLDAKVAHLEGDDLLPRLDALQGDETLAHLDHGKPLSSLERPILSANAYLGGWGIAKALERGADLVICPRVTDASLVLGPAAWHFGWAMNDWDRLASAVVAGHVLECGAQATGGNYAFFRDIEGNSAVPGFPIAEMSADGSFVVTKHPGTGGEVSVGTVTAQLLYEIDAPRYLNPDVTARFDSLQLAAVGPDRVRVNGVVGEPPPSTCKVCLNYHGGFKNQLTFLLSGLDIEAKASLALDTLWARLGGRDTFAETQVRLQRPREPVTSFETSTSRLTVAVKDDDRHKVGRRFTAPAVEMALASVPGFNLSAPPTRPTPFAVYWPTLVSRQVVEQRLVLDDVVEETPWPSLPECWDADVESVGAPVTSMDENSPRETIRVPLGRLCGARSGDKGGHANVGVWVRSSEAYAWLHGFLSSERLCQLIPEAHPLKVERFEFPNLLALNFVLRGFLGDGVAASLANDPQAKGLGEFLRAQEVEVPRALLP